MDNDKATRTCGQCHRQVAEANFALHETHCSRFLSVCPHCGDSVPTEQMDQHKEEQHTEVRCSKCHKKMERCQLPDHESDECVERLQTCQYCDLELAWRELDQHTLACGSRTELCRDCGRYVTLRDQARHDFTCSATEVNTSAGRTPAIRVRDEEDEEHNLSSQGGTSQLNNTYQALWLSDRPRDPEGDPEQISTCPHCHLALPLVTLHWHKVKCQVYLHMNRKAKLV